MRIWGRGDGHCSDITHWKYNSVYCTHFLPTPCGDFSQQHWGGVKSIIAKVCTGKLMPPDISSWCPWKLTQELLFFKFCTWVSVFHDLLWFSSHHWRQGILAKSAPWCIIILDVLAVAGGKAQSSPFSPALKVHVAPRKNSLSCLLVTSGSSPP